MDFALRHSIIIENPAAAAVKKHVAWLRHAAQTP
jgi:hypothetical protein